MKNIIEDIIRHPEQIHDKANAAIARIQSEHNVQAYQARLKKLYSK